MKRTISLNVLFVIPLICYASVSLAAYPYKCPKEEGQKDKWGFYKCNCTSYVAYKLNEAGIPFKNSYQQPKGNTWGDAGNKWIAAADRAGISHDKIPRAGDVAYWVNPGHVAYVESVAADGKTINISEYNWCVPFCYLPNARTVNVNTPSGYIHFNGIQPITSTPETESPFRCVLGDTICWSPPDSSCVDSQLLIYKGVKYYNDGTWKMALACNRAYKEGGFPESYWQLFAGHNDISSIGMCRQ